VQTVTISRPVTVVALIGFSALIVGITIWTAGKSYTKVDPRPFDEIRQLIQRIDRKPVSTHILAVILVPIIGNVLLFVPWGFLMFIALYTLDRPTVQTYLLTVLLGLSFTLVIEAWQYFLPSRVADVNDVISNTLGTVLGAVLGHMRQRVRFEFE
jgi:glycopeptide antibiotics resistance protein